MLFFTHFPTSTALGMTISWPTRILALCTQLLVLAVAASQPHRLSPGQGGARKEDTCPSLPSSLDSSAAAASPLLLSHCLTVTHSVVLDDDDAGAVSSVRPSVRPRFPFLALICHEAGERERESGEKGKMPGQR